MTYKEQIESANVPQHVAIIMDGNGRWAKKQGNIRLVGHKFGVGSVRTVTEAAAAIGIRYLTLFVFSTENWNRPAAEVQGLMSLLSSTIDGELADLMKNNVRLQVVGDWNLPNALADKLRKSVEQTKNNTGLTLVLALSYSGRWDMTQAAKAIAREVAEGKLAPDQIDDSVFQNHLATAQTPDPELVIRTSGEFRISNFLLWQAAYSEFYFTSTLWPDFNAEELYKAIVDYQHRERRFGKTSEQVEKK
ncbi:MAG: isoprenyl transferase [Marinilabiliaceae bacterium]|nr:isoprenyl transferase [Bacteroidales bacterium]MDY4521885.1 isoprenyl transferase [Bacteroidales bacterium]